MTKTQLTAVINDPRIADERHVNAYRVSGLLLVLYGFVPIGWTTYAFLSRDAPLGEFLRSVVWPVKTELVLAMTPYEWAFAVSLIVVGRAHWRAGGRPAVVRRHLPWACSWSRSGRPSGRSTRTTARASSNRTRGRG